MFYNGEEERPEKEELRLTDAFERPEESCIEVTATMVNVNAGKSRALPDRTATLDGYARFVAMVRSYRKEMTVEAAGHGDRKSRRACRNRPGGDPEGRRYTEWRRYRIRK